ncbi:MAG TPA: hypothetical protein VJX95_03735, partial [Oscillospiraceae bacterium]|nr:hypothetical protein [Oscillospiraceae bacterium]
MKTAMLKDALREIKKRFSQFLSIVAILALGVSFFVGIRVTGSNMRITADRYFDDTKFMDIKLISTLGLD